MSSLFFNQFPNITYMGMDAKNLTANVKLSEDLLKGATNFYPYTIKDGETSDSIAYDYYGDPNLVWLVFLCNKVEDPFNDWYKNTLDFEKYIYNKYGSEELARDTASYYKKRKESWYVNRNGEYLPAEGVIPSGFELLESQDFIKITPDTYERLSDKTGWIKVSEYDRELEENEDKRNIKLLDRRFVSVVENNLRVMMNG